MEVAISQKTTDVAPIATVAKLSTNIHHLGSSWNDPSLCLLYLRVSSGGTWSSMTSPNRGAPGRRFQVGWIPVVPDHPRGCSSWRHGPLGDGWRVRICRCYWVLRGTAWYYLRLLKYTTCRLCEVHGMQDQWSANVLKTALSLIIGCVCVGLV